jgi:acetyl-CoA synthetase
VEPDKEFADENAIPLNNKEYAMLTPGKTYEDVCRSFRWDIPESYNIAVDICDRHADGRDRPALIYETEDGEVQTFGFARLKQLSNRLANALTALGLKRGERVGILLPQRPETALAHLAIYKVGAVAVPLFSLFGTDALQYRLSDSQARIVITDENGAEKLDVITEQLPHLTHRLVVQGDPGPGGLDFWEILHQGASDFTPVRTRSDDPALIIYTSGTTGPPKGALHAHRTLLGHLPGVEFPHNFFPRRGDRFWTPADWAWIGGLIDVLFPSWHHGVPVLAHRARKFDPEHAFHLIAKHDVRNLFLPPTALKLMRQVSKPAERHAFRIRSIGSGGETLGRELLDWGRQTLGVTINEFYGQTEANLVVANCAEVMAVRPGSMGKPVPGHRVEIVDDRGNLLPPGTPGNVAVRRPDPVMFLEYWRNPDATAAKFVDDWCLTGDTARKDEAGYLWFVGRDDDLITSAGYRIGPGEIEDCLMQHPAVAMAAVVGVPDELRTEIVKAFVVPKPGIETSETLTSDIQDFVRRRLAAHEYPRRIQFVAELPMTATGKIIRRELRKMQQED